MSKTIRTPRTNRLLRARLLPKIPPLRAPAAPSPSLRATPHDPQARLLPWPASRSRGTGVVVESSWNCRRRGEHPRDRWRTDVCRRRGGFGGILPDYGRRGCDRLADRRGGVGGMADWLA